MTPTRNEAACEAYPKAQSPREPRGRFDTGMSADASMLQTVTTLRDPLIRPLGRKASTALESVFGLRTVGDLLRHYPRRYYTRGELTSLASLREDDHVTVLARVEYAKHIGPPPDQRYRS